MCGWRCLKGGSSIFNYFFGCPRDKFGRIITYVRGVRVAINPDIIVGGDSALVSKKDVSYLIKDLYISGVNAAANAGTEISVSFPVIGIARLYRIFLVPSVANVSSMGFYGINQLVDKGGAVTVVATDIGGSNVEITYWIANYD